MQQNKLARNKNRCSPKIIVAFSEVTDRRKKSGSPQSKICFMIIVGRKNRLVEKSYAPIKFQCHGFNRSRVRNQIAWLDAGRRNLG